MRGDDIPPSLGTGMSPCRSSRKTLAKGLFIFPSGEGGVEAGPLDEDLGNDVDVAAVNTVLQDSLRKLQVVVDIRKLAGDEMFCRGRRLEEGDMEHRMYGGRSRQLQFVGDLPNTCQHLVRAEVAEGELLVGPRRERRLYIRLELEEDEVANREGAF